MCTTTPKPTIAKTIAGSSHNYQELNIIGSAAHQQNHQNQHITVVGPLGTPPAHQPQPFLSNTVRLRDGTCYHHQSRNDQFKTFVFAIESSIFFRSPMPKLGNIIPLSVVAQIGRFFRWSNVSEFNCSGISTWVFSGRIRLPWR